MTANSLFYNNTSIVWWHNKVITKDSKLLSTKIIITKAVISHGCMEIGMINNNAQFFFPILFKIQLH